MYSLSFFLFVCGATIVLSTTSRLRLPAQPKRLDIAHSRSDRRHRTSQALPRPCRAANAKSGAAAPLPRRQRQVWRCKPRYLQSASQAICNLLAKPSAIC